MKTYGMGALLCLVCGPVYDSFNSQYEPTVIQKESVKMIKDGKRCVIMDFKHRGYKKQVNYRCGNKVVILELESYFIELEGK